MDDIDAMFSEMLGEMDLLTQVSIVIVHVVPHSLIFDLLMHLQRNWWSGVSCVFSHQLLQSLEQEISPPSPAAPASAPSTKEDIKLSIGFTDLNGDLTTCPPGHCCKMVTKSCLLKCCTVAVLLSSCCSCATRVEVSTVRQ